MGSGGIFRKNHMLLGTVDFISKIAYNILV